MKAPGTDGVNHAHTCQGSRPVQGEEPSASPAMPLRDQGAAAIEGVLLIGVYVLLGLAFFFVAPAG